MSLAKQRNEDGASTVEYGLALAGVTMLIFVAVFALGGSLENVFSSADDCISSGASAVC